MADADLLHQQEFTDFFAAVRPEDADFDVADVPAGLWPHLYMVKVEGRQLTLTVVGDHIISTFKRDLRGVDLRSITHGPHGDDIAFGYDLAIKAHKRIVMRRLVHFETTGLTRIVECGFAPLIAQSAVKRIVGCLFLSSAQAGQIHYGETSFHLREIA